MERVGEDRHATRVEPTEELDDGEEEIQQEGNEDIPLRLMVVVVPMAVTVSVAMGMTVVVIMFVSTHVSVLMLVLVLVGLHRSCLRYVN